MRILIVDDVKLNVMSIEKYLNNEYEIDVAYNGEEALSKIETFKPNIILLDIMMPVMDGFAVLRIIRKKECTSHIPVIIVTAKNSNDDIRDALRAGASDYITKPIDRIELLTKISIQKQIIDNLVEIQEYKVYANIHKSMNVAQRFQQSLMPGKTNREKVFPKSFELNLPKNIVSGDFYSIYPLEESTVVTLYDCLGHGVPAAMMTLVVHLTAKNHISSMNKNCLGNVVKNINDEIDATLKQSKDIHTDFGYDAIFLEINKQKDIAHFIGLNRPLFIIRENVSTIIIDGKEVNSFLSYNHYYLFNIEGCNENIETGTCSIETKTIHLLPNDSLYLFSDGFPDQLSRKFSELKISIHGLAYLLLQNQNKSMFEQKEVIYEYIKSSVTGSIQLDDILLLGFKI